MCSFSLPQQQDALTLCPGTTESSQVKVAATATKTGLNNAPKGGSTLDASNLDSSEVDGAKKKKSKGPRVRRHDLRIPIDEATSKGERKQVHQQQQQQQEELEESEESLVEDYLSPEIMNLKTCQSGVGQQSQSLKSPPVITVKDAAGNTFFSAEKDDISLYGTPKEEVAGAIPSEAKSSYMRQQIESR